MKWEFRHTLLLMTYITAENFPEIKFILFTNCEMEWKGSDEEKLINFFIQNFRNAKKKHILKNQELKTEKIFTKLENWKINNFEDWQLESID